jgi:hypothetical protein
MQPQSCDMRRRTTTGRVGAISAVAFDSALDIASDAVNNRCGFNRATQLTYLDRKWLSLLRIGRGLVRKGIAFSPYFPFIRRFTMFGV